MSDAHEPTAAMAAAARAVSDARKTALSPATASWAQSAWAGCLSRCASLPHAGDAYHRALDCGSVSDDPVFGATLALAERVGASDVERLQAYAIGAEVRVRVAATLKGTASAHAWDERGTAGVVGAAVAAATLLGLDADGMVRAFGISSSETVGYGCARGSAAAPLIAGKAAANGIIAALLAADNYTSCAGLDPGRGFFALVGYPEGQDAQWRAAACASLAGGFGAQWNVTERQEA